MSRLRKITIGVPDQLFELGLTEAQVHGLVNRWLVISLFKQGKLTADEAGLFLITDRDGFLSMLDEQGILYEGTANNGIEGRTAPTLTHLAESRQRIEALEEELAEVKYQLFQATKRLRDADKVTSEFIATVSHELRTPLNSIIGFAKLLLNQKVGGLNEVQHTDISIIYNSAKQLLGLVNDILDLSKIDAGKMRLNPEWVMIEEIVAGVMPTTLMLIEEKPIELLEEIEPNLPKVYVDRGRIRQVVVNIVSNAAKFTDAGSITLSVKKIEKDGRDWICCAIADTGIGIAAEDASKVFEAFRQIDSTIARRAEGTGLGMPISRRLVEMHGGELWFKSKVGQGSTFYFTIPLEPPDALNANVVGGNNK